MSAGNFKSVMRRFPASVTIIATGTPGHRNGLTATAVCSLTASPPQILVCLNAGSGTCQAIHKNGKFSVNVLNNNQRDLAMVFGGSNDGMIGEERFYNDHWRMGIDNNPVLEEAVATLECRLSNSHLSGSHFIVIGAVTNIVMGIDEHALVYRDGRFGAWAPRVQQMFA